MISRAPGKLPYSSIKKDKNTLICHQIRLQDTSQSPVIFLFEIPSRTTFFDVFPKDGYTSSALLRASMGEIDAIKSFTLDDMITNQTNETIKNNNYFISYFMKNLINIILPTILQVQINKNTRPDWINAFQRKSTKISSITIYPDINSRYPSELTHQPFTT